MKRSEFVNIVNEVADAEAKRVAETVTSKASEESESFEKMLAAAILEISTTSARTTALIIEKLGLVHFENE